MTFSTLLIQVVCRTCVTYELKNGPVYHRTIFNQVREHWSADSHLKKKKTENIFLEAT